MCYNVCFISEGTEALRRNPPSADIWGLDPGLFAIENFYFLSMLFIDQIYLFFLQFLLTFPSVNKIVLKLALCYSLDFFIENARCVCKEIWDMIR